MDEATNWQLEIIHRDFVHQVEWMERNGMIDAARDAAKALRDSGIIDVMERADLNPIIDGFNALNNSGVVTRKRAGEASTAESIEDSRNDFNDSPNGSTAADSLPTILKKTSKNSGHYAYSPNKRREIVEEYRKARDAHQITNKGAWAQSNHGISSRTLLNYEREFPEEK